MESHANGCYKCVFARGLDEEIYMSLPLGYTPPPGVTLPPNVVFKLNKSIYGLKQASRQWYHTFLKVLISDGFEQTHADNTLFVKPVGSVFIVVLVYVDDILITSNDDKGVYYVKNVLKNAFIDLGFFDFLLNFRIDLGF